MHKEISESVKLAAALMGMSLVIMLILFTVDIGKGVERDSYGKGHDIMVEMTNGQLESMLDDTIIVPVATAYSILNTNSSLIPEVRCGVCGKTTDLTTQQPCLLNHMQGKVNITVTEHIGGGYKVVLGKVLP